MSETRQPLAFLAAAFAAGCLLVSGLNAWRDTVPAGGRHLFEKAVALNLAQGHCAVHRRSMDEQALKWHLAETAGAGAETLVLGSSHSLPVSPVMLPPGRLLNLSASGAGLAEHIVSNELIRLSGGAPRLRVLVLDPWLLDEGADFGKWKERGELAITVTRRLLRQEAAGAGKFAEASRERGPKHLLSLRPLQEWSSDTLRLTVFSPTPVARENISRFLTIQPDGSFLDPSDAASPGEQASTALALRQFEASKDRHRYGTYAQFDPTLLALLRAWLNEQVQDGGRVWLLLPPYHPAIYPRIKAQENNKLGALSQLAAELSATGGVSLVGAFDPSEAGVKADDFSDGDHLTASGLEKLLREAKTKWTNHSAGQKRSAP